MTDIASTTTADHRREPLLMRGRRGVGVWIVWLIVALLVSPLAAVAVATGGGLIELPYPLTVLDERLPRLFRLHMLSAAMALGLTPLAIALRRRPAWHRPIGKAAAIATIVAGLTAVPVALSSLATTPAVIGFLCQAVLWVGLTTWGYVAIRAGKVRLHVTLMLAMAAVASGAIWTRPAMVLVRWAGLDFDLAYAGIVWAAWLLPLATVLAWRRIGLAPASARRGAGRRL